MAAGLAADTLIHTKLNRPRVAAQLVARQRLFTLLDEARALVTVTAPAGYGKSTLLSAWVQQSGLRYAWLSLDEGDNDPGVFLRYLLTAAASLDPTPMQAFVSGSRVGTAISSPDLVHNLADALDQLEETSVLVLDDYHVLHEPAIHAFLAELLRYPPPKLRLIISSRIDPPLPLVAMRAYNELTEIRARDLRFTDDEIAGYLGQELEHPPAPQIVEYLVNSTEGWPAGVHLATLLLRNQGGEQLMTLLQSHNRLAIDYLAAEVLAQRTPAEKDFLLKTSILTRMCPELCDALLAAAESPRAPSRPVLEQLRREDMFVTPLDDVGEWYRYHHLFRQLLEHSLRARAVPREIAALYSAASVWCRAHHLIGEAITYALQADDIGLVVNLIEENRHKAMNQEQWQQLEQWLHLLPRRIIDANAQLLVAEAWLLHKYDALALMSERLDLAEAVLKTSGLPHGIERNLRSEIAALHSQQHYSTGNFGGSLAAAREALALLPPTQVSARSVAWLYLGGSLYAIAGLQPALDALGAAEDYTQFTPGARRILSARCYLYWMAADLLQLKDTAEELLRLAQINQWADSLAWGHYFRGSALYALNDLSGAAEQYGAVLDGRHTVSGVALVQSAFGLASALLALGNVAAADTAAAKARAHAQQAGNLQLQQATAAFQARQAARQGRHDEALRWVTGASRTLLGLPMPHFFAPGVAMADILIEIGTPACRAEAESMLRELESRLSATYNIRVLIDVLLLKAKLGAREQRPDAACTALNAAISYAQPRGLLRPFLDADPLLAPLLAQCCTTPEQARFAAQVEASYGPLATAVTGSAPNVSAGVAPKSQPVLVQPQHPDLIELLTIRELEVLRLLARRLTNKEIAAALGISLGTVKQHTRAVFSKLHADNRRDAIVQAHKLGFELDERIQW